MTSKETWHQRIFPSMVSRYPVMTTAKTQSPSWANIHKQPILVIKSIDILPFIAYNYPLLVDVYYKEWRYKSSMVYSAGIDQAER